MGLKITFDKSIKKDILELLGKTTDNENLIIEKNNPEQKVLTFDGEEISLEDFGGIQAGSEVFIKNDLPSLMKFSRG